MEQEKYTYMVCTPEGLAALERVRDRKTNQGKKLHNHHGKYKIRVIIHALDVIRESGDVGINDKDLRGRLGIRFTDLSSHDITSVMHVISREVRPIVEAHRCDDETSKAS